MSEIQQEAASTTNAEAMTLESVEQKLYGETPAQQTKPEEKEAAAVDVKPVEAEAKAETKQDAADGEKPADGEEAEIKYTLEFDEDSPLKDEQVDEIAAFAKERGLSNEHAQELVDLQDKALRKFHAEQQEVIQAKRQEWLDASSRDKEIGGADFNANAELAKRVVDRFGSEDFKKTLNDSGLGNHPELLRVFARIGKAMGNDSLVFPRSQDTKTKSMEEIFYGSNN